VDSFLGMLSPVPRTDPHHGAAGCAARTGMSG
jgi:hypothetical protein